MAKKKKKMKGIQNFKVSLQLRWIKWVQLNDDQTYPQKKKEKRKKKKEKEKEALNISKSTH